MEQVLRQGGMLRRGGIHASYPEGGFDKKTVDILRKYGCVTGRSVQGIPFVSYPWAEPFRVGSDGLTVDGSDTATTALAAVDNGILTGGSRIFHIHGLYGTGIHWTQAHFDDFVEGLADRQNQGLIDVVTMREMYAAMYGSRPAATRIAA